MMASAGKAGNNHASSMLKAEPFAMMASAGKAGNSHASKIT